MYKLEIKKSVDKLFSKISKKNRKRFEIIDKTIDKILKNPHGFKPLRAPMQNRRRARVDAHFVIVYEIDEKDKTIIIWDYDHHKKIYKYKK